MSSPRGTVAAGHLQIYLHEVRDVRILRRRTRGRVGRRRRES